MLLIKLIPISRGGSRYSESASEIGLQAFQITWWKTSLPTPMVSLYKVNISFDPWWSTIHRITTSWPTGYSGADLKGLCTEAALIALTRRYPQIFFSKEKLAINVQEINISIDDFALAMRRIVPSARRSFAPVAKILPRLVRPLLDDKLKNIGRRLDDIFPAEPLQAMFNLTVKGSLLLLLSRYHNICMWSVTISLTTRGHARHSIWVQGKGRSFCLFRQHQNALLFRVRISLFSILDK